MRKVRCEGCPIGNLMFLEWDCYFNYDDVRDISAGCPLKRIELVDGTVFEPVEVGEMANEYVFYCPKCKKDQVFYEDSDGEQYCCSTCTQTVKLVWDTMEDDNAR